MSEHAPADLRYRLLPLSMIMLMIFMNFFSRTLFSPLLLQIEIEFSIGHAASSRLFLYLILGYVSSMLLSGFISAVLMHRKTLILSALVITMAMIIIGFSGSFVLLSFGFVLAGIGSGLYPASGLTVMTDMISRKDWQKALVLHDLGPHISMMAVPLLAVALLPVFSWRVLVISTGMLMLLTGIAFASVVRFGNTPGSPPTYGNLLQLFRIPSFWLLVVIYCLAFSSIQGVYLLIPTFLVSEAGFTPEYANTVFGISRGITILSLLTAGFAAQHVNLKVLLFLIMTVSGAATALMGIPVGAVLVPALCVQPALGALFPSVGFRALSLTVPMRLRSLAVSIVLPIGALAGGGVVPAILGYMGEAYSFSLGFILLGLLILLSALLVFFIRFLEQDSSP